MLASILQHAAAAVSDTPEGGGHYHQAVTVLAMAMVTITVVPETKLLFR